MASTTAGKAYLLVVDESLTDRLRLKGMFSRDVFQKAPEIEKYLVLSTIDCIFLESQLGTRELAEKVRQLFPGVLFVLTPLSEFDGLLPEEARNFIEAGRGRAS